MLAAVIIGLGVVPAIFLRERFVTPTHTAEAETKRRLRRGYGNIGEFFRIPGYTGQRLQEALHRHVSCLQWPSWLPHSSTTSLSTTCSAGTL